MSIDFSTLQGLTIPEGVVTQIADAAGRVLWSKIESNKPAILQVEKITSKTYAGETTYENEQFILLKIYPKSSTSTVNVTYGNVTKTLVFSGINAKTVYFGTFNGVSDSVETPVSGTLVIDGGYEKFEIGTFYTSKGVIGYCNCITGISDWGNVVDGANISIGDRAFYKCASLTLTSLPNSITSIGDYAFSNCGSLKLSSLPDGLVSIGEHAFDGCNNITISGVPFGITKIPMYAFYGCTSITKFTIHNGVTRLGYVMLGNNKNLNTFISLATTPPLCINDVNDDTSNTAAPFDSSIAKIIVPSGCLQTYRTADVWSSYKDVIVEAS